MPRRAPEPLHRLHVMVSESDHEWLKQNLAPGELSSLFRQIVKRLRGEKVLNNHLSLTEILDREELTL